MQREIILYVEDNDSTKIDSMTSEVVLTVGTEASIHITHNRLRELINELEEVEYDQTYNQLEDKITELEIKIQELEEKVDYYEESQEA